MVLNMLSNLIIITEIIMILMFWADIPANACKGRKLQAFQNKRLKNKIISDVPMYSTTERSKIECCKHCIDKIGCLAFFYSNIKQECRMYDHEVTDPTKTREEMGWSYYHVFKVCPNDTSFCPVENKGYRYNDVMCFCYKFYSMPRNFEDATLDCMADGGSLVKIDRQLKQDEIVRYLESIGPHEKQYVWLESSWSELPQTQVTSSAVKFARWKTKGSPSPNGHQKLALSLYGHNNWYYKDDLTELPYICEISEDDFMI